MDNNLRLILCLLVVLCGIFIIAFRWKRVEDRKKNKRRYYYYYDK